MVLLTTVFHRVFIFSPNILRLPSNSRIAMSSDTKSIILRAFFTDIYFFVGQDESLILCLVPGLLLFNWAGFKLHSESSGDLTVEIVERRYVMNKEAVSIFHFVYFTALSAKV